MAATTARKVPFSVAASVKVVATATAGTAVHAAGATADGSIYDEIYLWAWNSHTADVVLTIEMYGVTVPENTIEVTIPFDSGLVLVLPGMLLENSQAVAAFATVANVVAVYGFVNRITQDAD